MCNYYSEGPSRRSFLKEASLFGTAAMLSPKEFSFAQENVADPSFFCTELTNFMQIADSSTRTSATKQIFTSAVENGLITSSRADRIMSDITSTTDPAAVSEQDQGRFELVLQNVLMWYDGSGNKFPRLRYRFVDRNPTIEPYVVNAFNTWAPLTGIQMVPVTTGTAEINISFLQRGFWSYIGKESLGKSVSLNLQAGLPINNYQRAALHEVGHALGGVHEMANPGQPIPGTTITSIPWNEQAVIDFYARPVAQGGQGWTAEMTRQNVLRRYSQGEVTNSAFDRLSILLYTVPRSLMRPGLPEIVYQFFEQNTLNNVLSATDRSFMSRAYGVQLPPDPANPTSPDGNGQSRLRAADAATIQLGASARSNISSSGDVKLFSFNATDASSDIVIETIDEAQTPVIFELHRGEPFDATTLIRTSTFASGKGRGLMNGFLDCGKLANGRYFVTVRHAFAHGTGDFQLLVSNNILLRGWDAKITNIETAQKNTQVDAKIYQQNMEYFLKGPLSKPKGSN